MTIFLNVTVNINVWRESSNFIMRSFYHSSCKLNLTIREKSQIVYNVYSYNGI